MGHMAQLWVSTYGMESRFQEYHMAVPEADKPRPGFDLNILFWNLSF
jgi:hypothetical protein